MTTKDRHPGLLEGFEILLHVCLDAKDWARMVEAPTSMYAWVRAGHGLIGFAKKKRCVLGRMCVPGRTLRLNLHEHHKLGTRLASWLPARVAPATSASNRQPRPSCAIVGSGFGARATEHRLVQIRADINICQCTHSLHCSLNRASGKEMCT